jgi:hypothetical protein
VAWKHPDPCPPLAEPPLNDDLQPSSAVSSPTQPGPVLYMPSAAGDSVPVSPSSPHAPDLSTVRACLGEWVGTMPAQEPAPACLMPQALLACAWGGGPGICPRTKGICLFCLKVLCQSWSVMCLQPGQKASVKTSVALSPNPSRGSEAPSTWCCPLLKPPLGQVGGWLCSCLSCTHWPPVLFCSSSVGTAAWAAHPTSAALHQVTAGRPQT